MWVTAKECINLPGFASREHNARTKLDKLIQCDATKRRKKQGSKAFEYHISCLPKDAQSVLLKRQMVETLSTSKSLPAVKPELDVTELTEAQRICSDARAALCKAVIDIEIETGAARTKAIACVVDNIRLGVATPHLMEMAKKANARSTGKITLSTRTLNGWVLEYCKATSSIQVLTSLAPRPSRSKVKPVQVSWFTRFMAFYRDPRGLPVTEVYQNFCDDWERRYQDQPLMLGAIPSYDAVLRMLRKLPKLEVMRGRVTGSAWTALQPFVRRDWSVLTANDVWIGDGHGMKMTIRHPEHGNRFKPELTMIIDGVTRFIVGWSISYSENVLAISDAMRHAIQKNGVPLFYYSDNGGGQKNKTLDADITGVLPRLGIGHETGIPGNAQGRGIIERAHQTILIRLARQFETFNGSSADRDWVRANSVAIDSAVNAAGKGRELTTKQQRDLKKLPTWEQLINAVEAGIEWYNNRHEHSELPKRDNGRHYTPAQFRAEKMHEQEQHYLSEAELREMFRPTFERQAIRGEVKIFNNIYFSEALSQVEGEKVQVAVDIHDPEKVIVRRMDGTYVCDAVWDGNKRAAFPVSMADDAREKRATRRRSNVERKLEQIETERNPHLTIEHAPDFSLLGGNMIDVVAEEPVFVFPNEREKWLLEQQKKKVG